MNIVRILKRKYGRGLSLISSGILKAGQNGQRLDQIRSTIHASAVKDVSAFDSQPAFFIDNNGKSRIQIQPQFNQ